MDGTGGFPGSNQAARKLFEAELTICNLKAATVGIEVELVNLGEIKTRKATPDHQFTRQSLDLQLTGNAALNVEGLGHAKQLS